MSSRVNSAQGNFHVSNVPQKRRRDDDEDMEFIVLVVGFIQIVVAACYGQKYRLKELTWNAYDRSQIRATWMNTLKIDRKCRDELRLDIPRFEKLCHLLETKGGLVTTKHVTVKEVVALFLHILAHDLKNRTIQAVFARSGETVSRQFHIVLGSILKLGKDYIKKVDHTTSYVDDNQWKWFEGAVGALDGTHIKMTVPIEDRPRYRDRKGDISTNVLATCDPDLCFTYVLPGWEGSASDPRVLRDALRRPNGLKVPRNKYFLVDLGYTNSEGFLSPFKNTRYHLNLWRGNTPTNYKELFNLRHSSARNTIERAFGLLKKRWAILRDASFYPKKIQIRIINACFILHNFLREEKMEERNFMQEVERDLLRSEAIDAEDDEDDYISTARSTNEWNEFRDDLAKKMCQRQGKQHVQSTVQPTVAVAQKRGYLTWNTDMDNLLISTLYEQINEGNKGDGDFKTQAHQAVVDKLRVEMGISATVNHVSNRIKVWKKHYAMITEIRTYTKFKWDEEKKMLVIPIEDLAEWKAYCEGVPHASAYQNKRIQYWDDICTLFASDRATGDGAEHFEESATAMELENEANSTAETGFGESNKRQKRDRLADAVTSFAESFKEYVNKAKEPPRPTCKEIYEIVSNIDGLNDDEAMMAVKRFVNGKVDEFEMLKSLPDDRKKRNWIYLLIND